MFPSGTRPVKLSVSQYNYGAHWRRSELGFSFPNPPRVSPTLELGWTTQTAGRPSFNILCGETLLSSKICYWSPRTIRTGLPNQVPAARVPLHYASLASLLEICLSEMAQTLVMRPVMRPPAPDWTAQAPSFSALLIFLRRLHITFHRGAGMSGHVEMKFHYAF